MARELILAKTAAEAVAAKTESAVFVAGGTEVNRLGSPYDADILISLKKCSDLSDIRTDSGYVTIGSMCTFQQLVESAEVPGYLKEAALFMASRTKRNMATIGGNIASLRSDSYLIPTLMAVGAVLEMAGADGSCNRIGIAEYVDENEAGKLIVSVTVPAEAKVVSKRYANTAQSHAVLTMSASLSEEGIWLDGAVKNVGLLHFCDLEKAFREDPDISEEKIIEMVRSCSGLHTADDMFGSDEYKRYLIAVTAYDLHKRLTGKEA
jgi:putative selenate reductase FAD-binding subunit